MIYEKEFTVYDFLCNNGELTLKNIINYFIETSNLHSLSVGLSSRELMENNYTWMIYKWRIKILKYPKVFDKIKVKTWASGFKGLNAEREFEMYLDDEKIAYASSIFLLIELNKRKPVVIPEYFAERFGIKEEKYFEKIKRINLKKDEKVLNEANYKIMKRDIDINNHVNNSIYAELLFESLPEIYSEIKFSEININYMKELVLGDRVVIDVYLEKDEFYFFFRNEDSSEMYARIWANVN